ncbi:unnamed protein product [Symbiodinium sp. KB8]|nr:unnamed protein product [Symbiodinium sp. KB8]
MVVDVHALRAALENKRFHDKESSLLKMIQQAEAIQLQQQDLLATAKDIAEVFFVKVDNYKFEATPFDSIANLAEQVAVRLRCKAASLVITLDGNPLPKEASLSSLGITAGSQLDFKEAAPKGKKRRKAKSLQQSQQGTKIQKRMQRVSHVLVKTLTGKTIIVREIGACTTVEELKQRIEEREGIPPDQQRVVFSGKQLEDDCTLADYDIPEAAVMHLVLRLRGGMYDPISGREGFKVLSDEIVFDNGSTLTFDGSSESLECFGQSFASKAEMLSFLEEHRIEALLKRLQEVQSRSERVEKEAQEWMAKAVSAGDA